MLRNKAEPKRRWLDLAPGDPVIVVTGKDKGKQGEELRTIPDKHKIVVKGVNILKREAKDNDKALDAAVGDVVTITGQKPALIKARKSVAAFKLRAGQIVGIKTTLRGRRMWYFLDKLRGLEVSITTTARSDDEARSLLTRLGMPFRKR